MNTNKPSKGLIVLSGAFDILMLNMKILVNLSHMLDHFDVRTTQNYSATLVLRVYRFNTS